ncbi:uncharacterized protein PHALS_03166 [Plasmopara halstedii]|uniref:Uncharacterized protein n=1 Tax=Plasmopara halstedii TaxID=4781 RepID=A0A0P1A8F8_PLAHL|nr:uncharacterized protein PHALS_03166 [Plasmopara halstedii]CEG36623.1 hypothetical protein PHALS_03166 [Plasmopara halstedii]|eukprot:XP_024572992.1 hypothetical protein PHALS_03166 [Plasmopara halstedii]
MSLDELRFPGSLKDQDSIHDHAIISAKVTSEFESLSSLSALGLSESAIETRSINSMASNFTD